MVVGELTPSLWPRGSCIAQADGELSACFQISFCAADRVGVTPCRILQLAEKCDWLAKPQR
jgi:hypothetical protein